VRNLKRTNFEGEYAFPEEKTLEELWWPVEVLHNVR
jgi:hypothetical protein